MSKNCANCEHRNVCEMYHNPKFKMTKCTDWSGWHDVKEELPKEGDCVLTLHKIRGRFCYTVCNFYDGNFEDGINPSDIMNRTVVAWRELKYEVEK